MTYHRTGPPNSAATAVIMISTTISLIRVVIEMAVAGQDFLQECIQPMSAMISTALLLSVIVWLWTRKASETMPEQSNPTELKSALAFGAVYAIILLAVAATRVHFERNGLYVVAVFSGLTDIDAITLSTSRMVAADRLTPQIGWKVIVAAVMANLIFKAGLVAMLGHRRLFLRVASLFGILVIVGGVLIATRQ